MSDAGLRGKLVTEWRGSARLRLGAWAILGILLFYAFLVLADARAAWRTGLEREVDRLGKVRSLVGQDVWFERAQAAAAARAQLEGEIPVARTAGLAQAAMQARMRELTGAFGAAVTVDVAGASPVAGQDGLVQVPATLTAPTLGLARSLQLVQSIESQPQLLVIDSLTLDNRDPARLNATVRGFFRIDPEASTDGSP